MHELDNKNPIDWDGLCFNLQIDLSSRMAPCNEEIVEGGWYDDVIQQVGYHPDIVHSFFDSIREEWSDFRTPPKIFTCAGYVVHWNYALGGCLTQAIIAQAYVTDYELAERVAREWIDQMRERKAELQSLLADTVRGAILFGPTSVNA